MNSADLDKLFRLLCAGFQDKHMIATSDCNFEYMYWIEDTRPVRLLVDTKHVV